MWAEPQPGDDDDSSEEDDSDEESDDEDGAPQAQGQEMSREERRAAAKAKKEAAIKRKQGAPTAGDLPPSDSDEDEEIDSDEAFGESDEEKYMGYNFNKRVRGLGLVGLYAKVPKSHLIHPSRNIAGSIRGGKYQTWR